MKNSPEEEWFKKLQGRLGEYTEEPDAEVWEKIAGRMNDRPDPVWIPWAHRVGVAVSLLFIVWSLNDDRLAPVITERNEPAENKLERAQGVGPSHRQPADADTPGSLSRTPATRLLQPKDDTSGHVLQAETAADPGEVQTPPREGMDPDADDRQLLFADSAAAPPPVAALPTVKEEPVIPARKKRYVLFYGSVSTSLAFQKLMPYSNDGVRIESFYARPVLSTDRLGVALQGGIQLPLGRCFEMYTGLSFYRQSQALVYQYYSDETQAAQEKAFDYIVGPGIVRKAVRYDMLNAGAEAGLLYRLAGDRLQHKFGAGLLWQHGLIRMSGDDTYDNGASSYLHYQLFYRNELALNNRLNLFIQPFYTHVVTSAEVMHEPFAVRPYRAGLTFGVVFRAR